MASSISQHVSSLHDSLFGFLKAHRAYATFLLVVVVGIVIYGIFSVPNRNHEIYTVSAGPIKQYFKASGSIQTPTPANLAFQSDGVVSYVGVKNGDQVSQGKVLATLEAGDTQSSLILTQSKLAEAKSALLLLKDNALPESLTGKEQKVAELEASLDQSYTTLPDTIQSVDAVTADVIKNKLSSLFVLTADRYILSFSSCDQNLQGQIEQKRTNLEDILAGFQKKSGIVSPISSTGTIEVAFDASYQAAGVTNDLVNDISKLLLSQCSLSNKALDSYRESVSSSKAAMTILFSDVTSKRSMLLDSKNAIEEALNGLTVAKKGADPYKLKVAMAVVSKAESEVTSARLSTASRIIYAPFSGIVSGVRVFVGQTVTPGKTVITMYANDGFEVVAKIPEEDITKIKVGAPVDITFDAYGTSVKFPATVATIDKESTKEGVPMRKVTIVLSGSDPRIVKNMMADLNILTDDRSEALMVPVRFVRVVNGNKGKVIVQKDGKEEMRDVLLGLREEDGNVEILDGLVGGDIIVMPSDLVGVR